MKVKYANGEVSSVRKDLGRELVRAGIVEEVKDGSESLPAPGATLPVEWQVVTVNGIGKPYAAIQLTIGHSVLEQTKNTVQSQFGQHILQWAGDPARRK
jgi:hypothetical protein